MTEEELEKQYIKGFNNGYQLQSHEPKLLAAILKSADKNHLYIKALQAGARQFEKDIQLQILEQGRLKTKHQDRER